VIIIGWGEDDTNGPYWILRNSFGKDWGMEGDFLVSRGKNDFGIEEEVAAFEVRRCDPTNNHECLVVEPKAGKK
jgi:C1A family cysteine protease